MHSFTPKLILAASCFFLHLKSLSAAPVEEVVKVIQARQENGDDDGGALTDPFRRDYKYVSHFQLDQNPTWYTISSSSTLGTYLPFTTGNPKPALPPLAANQGQGTGFNVDHVLELQVIASFVQSSNPNPATIPDASWKSLRDVVTNSVSNRPQRTPIASAIGSFNNLGGIPSTPNGSKQYYFRAALNTFIPITNAPQYIIDANRRYLQDRRAGILNVIANVGIALGAAGSGGPQNPVGEAIFTAWARFSQEAYDRAIVLLGG